ncbi:unnamed protein product [Clonostachys rosea]|uniref:Xylanolytic transcriptional activator regulatory domain-containing protein n=1 Tax=Bionectria ochroleuca TaxID=29856 RepID=A0ABY6V5U2_BIOOC|nr:unnamed protein product [Clonostachys rosea]
MCPLWAAQTQLLLTWYAIFSGEEDIVSTAMVDYGFFTLVYRSTRRGLDQKAPRSTDMPWKEWAFWESWKRVLGAIFIISTLSVVMFDVNPSFNTVHDLDFDTLDDERLWNAVSEAEWRGLRTLPRENDRRSIRDVVTGLVSGDATEPCQEPYHISALTTLIVIYGIVVYIWQATTVAETFEPLGQSPTAQPNALASALLHTASQALARCHELLSQACANRGSALGDRMETSLLFNCQCVLRIAYIRMFTSTSILSRPSFVAFDDAAVESAISHFVSGSEKRRPGILKAVEAAFEGFRVSVNMGHMLVRKTAALRWSLEHAVAGWDCALFVTKWVHSVEIDALNGVPPDAEESRLLTSVREVLEEADYEALNDTSLAAGLAKTWSAFLNDVWVWGITPRMGSMLSQLATAYEGVYDKHRGSRVIS